MHSNFTAALVGNPNSGKSTVFNGLTGSNQLIGNWPGVTVEKKEGFCRFGKKIWTLVDLPGIYSMSASGEDEKVARDFLVHGRPNLLLNIVDAANLERNLYLTTQLLEIHLPMIVILTMADRARSEGVRIDAKALSRILGCPVVMVNATLSPDLDEIRSLLVKAIPAVPAHKVTFPDELERCLDHWRDLLKNHGVEERWWAVKLLEGDEWARQGLADSAMAEDLQRAAAGVEEEFGEKIDVLVAEHRYKFIDMVMAKSVTRKTGRETLSNRVDRVLLHRFLGIPIFLAVMYLGFSLAIALGNAFIDFFDILFGTVFVDLPRWLLESMNSPSWLTAVLTEGVGSGIRTVSTFAPVMFFMFLVLAILEDSGYMARAAFVMDRFMRFIGLPGKAFVPMLVGFGCTVPAIMGARTLQTTRERYLTIFMVPFMSCGARLPVYVLFGAALFGSHSALVVFSLYVLGILLSIVTGLMLKKTLFRGPAGPFVMELPPYHVPRGGRILRLTWLRLRHFIIRAGKVIVLMVLVLGTLNTMGVDGKLRDPGHPKSILAVIGRAVTPIFTPMGIQEDNWPATVGLFTGIFAKEAIVGTLGSLYSQERSPAQKEGPDLKTRVVEALKTIPSGLRNILRSLKGPLESLDGEAENQSVLYRRIGTHFTIPEAYAYLLFVLIYFPCLAAMATAIKEMNWFHGLILALYLSLLGWILATLFYQVVEGNSITWILAALGMLILLYVGFIMLGRSGKTPGQGSSP